MARNCKCGGDVIFLLQKAWRGDFDSLVRVVQNSWATLFDQAHHKAGGNGAG